MVSIKLGIWFYGVEMNDACETMRNTERNLIIRAAGVTACNIGRTPVTGWVTDRSIMPVQATFIFIGYDWALFPRPSSAREEEAWSCEERFCSH